jgi:glycolate oxidase iron-sulfur subunit
METSSSAVLDSGTAPLKFGESQKTAKQLFREAEFDNILKCVHCGLCLDNCPTYRELGDEKDSPRGRLYLMRGVWEGELDLTSEVTDPLSRCLDCRACETACPSGVPYGELLEKARGVVHEVQPQSLQEKTLRTLLLKGLFRSTFLLSTASKLLKLYAWTGLPQLITNTPLGKLLPQSFVFQQHLLPDCSGRSFKQKHADRPLEATHTAEPLGTVGLFSGCIMDVSEAAVHESTMRLLRAVGYRVMIPGSQGCCGALHVHSGDRETARELALKNLDAFEGHKLDAIITNAAGCSAQLREYHHLFPKSDKNHLRNWDAVEGRIVDVLEFLARHPEQIQRLDWRTDEDVVLYDAPCHLMHAQKVDANPRALVNSLPGVTLVPLTESNWCCGSAGIYNLLQPELSSAVLARKIQSVRETLEAHPKALTIVTGNPGCLYQIRAGIRAEGIPLRVIHPAVYLAERLRS